jgi:TRAP-type C4-dicarboxylate transport system substrate-binding protein
VPAKPVAVAAAVAVALVGAACSASAGDKAGGRQQKEPVTRPVGEPVTLTLVTGDDRWASEFAATADRLSRGSIHIETQVSGQALIQYEGRLVRNVLAGRADLASVGARVWDTMGVNSFRALVAPFLVDSLDLERRVLESALAARMLRSVEPLGLVGLAILPGALRRPFGLTHSFMTPKDFARATIGIRPGGVARTTFESLGARVIGYRIGSLAGLDGAELDVATIARVGYDARAGTLTSNVALWSRPETIVIRRNAFARLTPAQQRILRSAGAAAVAPVLARLEQDEKEGLAAICGRNHVSLVRASGAARAALRAAVQPVYQELARDPLTNDAVAEIRRLRATTTGPAVLRCPAEAAPSDELDGAWSKTVTRTELVAAGASAPEAKTYAGSGTLELHHGRWSFRGDRTTVTGTFVVEDNVVRLTMRTCTANPCTPGATTAYGWSVYRDTLTLTPRSGHSWPLRVVKPARRLR